MTDLATPLQEIIGTKMSALFESEFAIATVGELLRHAPRRYEHRGALTDMASLAIGAVSYTHLTLPTIYSV